MDFIKEDLLNMGFICISSKIHEVSDPDNYNIDDKDNQGELYGFIDLEGFGRFHLLRWNSKKP